VTEVQIEFTINCRRQSTNQSIVHSLYNCVKQTGSRQGCRKAPRQRTMRHGNPRGTKNKEVRGGQNLPFYFKGK